MFRAFLTQRYSRQGLWTLFLMCALPQHAWSMILAFRDLSWIADRTNTWDAVGDLSYALVFAFVESLVIFLLAALLGFLVSARWKPEWRVGLLSVLVLVLSVWAMVAQLYFLLGFQTPAPIIGFLAHSGHPFRLLYGGVILLVAASFFVPVILVLRSEKAVRFVGGLIERLSLLATLYLFFDLAALAIVIIRNL